MKYINYFCIVIMMLFLFSCTDRHEKKDIAQKKPVRYGMVTGLKPEKAAYYRDLHAKTWEGVLKKIKECNIQNYTIYQQEIEGKLYLFSYYEYIGDDYEADMKRIAADPITQRWWKETDPCQDPLPEAKANHQIWHSMEEVFHTN